MEVSIHFIFIAYWFKLGTKAISTLAPVVASVATGNPLPMLLNVTGSAEEIGNTVKNAANSIQSLKDEYWKEEDVSNDESTINNIRKFREEFSDALKSDDIKNVVVMIDDLDRCRPERIIEILEPVKMSCLRLELKIRTINSPKQYCLQRYHLN